MQLAELPGGGRYKHACSFVSRSTKLLLSVTESLVNLKTLKTTFRNLLTWICFEYKVKVWCPEMGCEVCWWLVAAMGGGCTGRHSTTGDC